MLWDVIKELGMKEKMPWLKARLRDIGKTPTALAKALGIAAPRVYEMIAGRRHIQQNEIAPMAAFLDWSIEKINQHLPAHSKVPVAAVTKAAFGHSVIIDGQHVIAMIDASPKVVHVEEVRDAVLSCIAERFVGRPIGEETIERGLALACFQVKLAGMAKAPT